MKVNMSKRTEERNKILSKVYLKLSVTDVIRTSNVNGEFRLSSSKSHNSPMKREIIIINDIQTLKKSSW